MKIPTQKPTLPALVKELTTLCLEEISGLHLKITSESIAPL